MSNIDDYICCICLDDKNLNTFKCNRCVYKFHVDCFIKWNKDNCPCCRIIITNYKLKLKKIYNSLYENKYSLLYLVYIISSSSYLIYNYSHCTYFEIFLFYYHSFILFIGILLEIIMNYYNIDLEYPNI